MHGPLLSAGDLARLRTACGRETVDPARSLFGPDSVTSKFLDRFPYLGVPYSGYYNPS